MTLSYVYALVDPRDDEVRYIGITKQLPWRRFQGHISESKKNTRTKKRAWIRSLLNQELEPVFVVLKSGDFTWEQLCVLEIAYIAQYTVEGYDLTNLTEGGDGSHGFAAPRTEEWSRKLSAAIIAHNAALSEEQKTARSLKRVSTIVERNGGTYPGYTKGRTSPTKGRTLSEETKQKMKEAHTRRWAKIRAEGRYEEVCANIAVGTKRAMNAGESS